MNPTFSPEVCPLCGQANQCAMEIARATGVSQGPCWCSQLSFEPELLARIPQAARGKSCVCAACAKAATEDANATRI